MKATIIFLLMLFMSIFTFGQTTETRYFNGQYTKESALLKLNAFFTVSERGEFHMTFTKTEVTSPYQFSGNWILKNPNGNASVTRVKYLISNESLTITLENSTLYPNFPSKDGGIAIDKKDAATKSIYESQAQMYILNAFSYLLISKNTTPTQTKTATLSVNTVGQTTETRYYNGKYTKETALQKVNAYMKLVSTHGYIFNKTDGQSVYQFSGTWAYMTGNTKIAYFVEDKSVTVKLIGYASNGLEINKILQDEKHHLHGVVKMTYDVEVLVHITQLLEYMQINNNRTPSQPTPAKATADKKYYRPFTPVDISNKLLSAEVKTFFNSYNNNPNNVAEYVTDIGNALDKQNYKGQAVYAKFSEILKEVYRVDKYAAFRMMMIVDKKTLDETLKLIPNDIRNYLREEARFKIQKEKAMN